ncbi:hypothetical protein TNCV_166141 [Trichonephila clavipes]|nr:hypothetical protein TNCV_166141 [Trichonephila clavipes]
MVLMWRTKDRAWPLEVITARHITNIKHGRRNTDKETTMLRNAAGYMVTERRESGLSRDIVSIPGAKDRVAIL